MVLTPASWTSLIKALRPDAARAFEAIEPRARPFSQIADELCAARRFNCLAGCQDARSICSATAASLSMNQSMPSFGRQRSTAACRLDATLFEPHAKRTATSLGRLGAERRRAAEAQTPMSNPATRWTTISFPPVIVILGVRSSRSHPGSPWGRGATDAGRRENQLMPTPGDIGHRRLSLGRSSARRIASWPRRIRWRIIQVTLYGL